MRFLESFHRTAKRTAVCNIHVTTVFKIRDAVPSESPLSLSGPLQVDAFIEYSPQQNPPAVPADVPLDSFIPKTRDINEDLTFQLRNEDLEDRTEVPMTTTFTPGPTPNSVRSADGKVLTVPAGWVLLPPGDAALTRRVKAAGEHWVVAEKKGRKVFSRGIWASAATIEKIRADLVAERSTEGFAKKRAADAQRRDKAQADYVEDFFGAVVDFLAFHPTHADLAQRLARAVTEHATPVGSGTVARTKSIPVEQRAEAAVIAWMRHQTTGYDSLAIPRVKGKRRELRRMLAQRSKELLTRYRRGEAAGEGCPLKKALP